MDEEIVVEIEKKEKSQNKSSKKKKKQVKNTNKKNKSKTKRKGKFFKFLGIIILIIIALVILLTSSVFNIKSIETEGNKRLSQETIISFSGLELYKNIFGFNKLEAKRKIKENAYVEDVSISRKLPDKLIIKIEEREPKYQLEIADSFVYINNQGYVLEITNVRENIPIILGTKTDLTKTKPGDRIVLEDLKKLDKVIKIYETAKSNDLSDLITKIDISDDKNYTLILETEGKKVYLGDYSNLNTKLLYLKAILESSTGKNGEIFLNVDLNSDNCYFRPSSI